MEYWLQLDIDYIDNEIEVVNDDEPVDNWLQDNNPLLASIPEQKLKPQQESRAVIRVSCLKFGQNEQGYYLLDGGERIALNSGDIVIHGNNRITVTITKLNDSRQSVMPIEYLSQEYSVNPMDTTRQEDPLGLLNAAFTAPSYKASDVNVPVYEDMKPKESIIPSESPLDGIDDLFNEGFVKPFEQQVPIHQQNKLYGHKESEGSVRKLKKLLWGEE
jgi:hypothetical protein